MKKMNQQQADAYIRGGGNVCPFCGDSNIDAGNISPDTGVLTQAVECLECGQEWSDVYRLVGVFDPLKMKTFYTKNGGES